MVDLKTLIRTHPECLENKGKLKSFLNDMFPASKRLNNVIAEIYAAGIHKQMQNLKQIDELCLNAFLAKLNTDLGIAKEYSYDGLACWAAVYDLSLPGKRPVENADAIGFNGVDVPAYKFMGRVYHTSKELCDALADNWDEGKKHLRRGMLSGFFVNISPEITVLCREAEKEIYKTPKDEDKIFYNLLYKVFPEFSAFCWKGRMYDSLESLGKEMLNKLWQNDDTDYNFWNEILGDQVLTDYYVNTGGKKDKFYDRLSEMESRYKGAVTRHEVNYYHMAYTLSDNKLFIINNEKFADVPELTQYMKRLLSSSYQEFEQFCKKLITYEGTLDVQFEAWLIALGKTNELDAWRKQLQE